MGLDHTDWTGSITPTIVHYSTPQDFLWLGHLGVKYECCTWVWVVSITTLLKHLHNLNACSYKSKKYTMAYLGVRLKLAVANPST